MLINKKNALELYFFKLIIVNNVVLVAKINVIVKLYIKAIHISVKK